MRGLLAIETATDACSVALWRDGAVEDRHAIIPRQHSQRLLGMLGELVPGGDLRAAGVEALAYGCGPGSFTGLRVAASAVQGLCYSSGLPALPVSTLACQVQTALGEGLVGEGDLVLSLIDARINEVYAGMYRVQGGLPVALSAASACAPAQFTADAGSEQIVAVGSGANLLPGFPLELQQRIARSQPELLPRARDLVPLALEVWRSGGAQTAQQVQPVYVRDEINWKKLAEQGKQK